MFLLYNDYELRILREKRDLADSLKRDIFLKLFKARDSTRSAQRALDSWRRIDKLLASSKSLHKKAEYQALLERYPPKAKLIAEATATREREKALQIAYDDALVAYQCKRDKVNEQEKLRAWLNRQFGHVLAKELFSRFGRIELICKYNSTKGELDIYFGGRKEPDGPGHAHWVFNRRRELVFRRDPGKR